MSSANLDLVRSIYAAWRRGDYGPAEWADPEIEFVYADGPSPGTRTGLAGVAEGTRSLMDVWDDFRVEAEVVREIDSERVLVLARNSGRGKRSGLDFGQWSKNASVFHIRDGKVTRLTNYWDRDRAFADLGLTPDTGT
jgi:ketosteroid isomerase-like protein